MDDVRSVIDADEFRLDVFEVKETINQLTSMITNEYIDAYWLNETICSLEGMQTTIRELEARIAELENSD